MVQFFFTLFYDVANTSNCKCYDNSFLFLFNGPFVTTGKSDDSLTSLCFPFIQPFWCVCSYFIVWLFLENTLELIFFYWLWNILREVCEHSASNSHFYKYIYQLAAENHKKFRMIEFFFIKSHQKAWQPGLYYSKQLA